MNKTGASGYEDKRLMNRSGDALEVHYRTDQDLREADSPTFSGLSLTGTRTLYSVTIDFDGCFSFLSPFIPGVGDKVMVSGGAWLGSSAGAYIFAFAERTSSITIGVRSMTVERSTESLTFTSGNTTTVEIALCVGERIE